MQIPSALENRINEQSKALGISSDEYINKLLIAYAKETDDVVIDLLKLEYGKCTDRYDNIFKAVWTNFSYMAIVAGAILTFGGAKFPVNQTLITAAIPLIFWYFASFLPLNRYGDEVVKRLGEIEEILTKKYFTTLPEDIKDPKDKFGLFHFTRYENRVSTNTDYKWWQVVKKRWRKINRVRHMVFSFIICLVVFVTYQLITTSNKSINSQKIEIEVKDSKLAVKAEGLPILVGSDKWLKIAEIIVVDEKGQKTRYNINSEPVPTPVDSPQVQEKKLSSPQDQGNQQQNNQGKSNAQ